MYNEIIFLFRNSFKIDYLFYYENLNFSTIINILKILYLAYKLAFRNKIIFYIYFEKSTTKKYIYVRKMQTILK